MKLLITGAVSWTSEQIKLIEELNNTVIFVQDESIPLREQNIDVREIEGVICNGLFLYNDIKEFESLKFIQLTSAGFDRVPIDYIKEHNIKIYNARGVYSVPMSEFAISGVLQLYKNSQFFLDNKKQKKWIKNRELKELNGSEVLIVGSGSVGQHCAKLFKAFNCFVYGIDLYPVENENFIKVFHLDKLEERLRSADVVVLTLPLTNETKNLFNESKFSLMKKGSVLVNIARGGIVQTDALIDALKNKLSGAVLDVFDTEPLPENSELWNLDNVILTPHNSFVGDKNVDRLIKVVLKNFGE